MTEQIRTGVSALHEWMRISADELSLHTDRLNAINVFPVPDGDTGTNMLATLKAAVEGLEADDAHESLGSVLTTAGRAGLAAAQGNSGTLLSVFLLGLGESWGEAQNLTGPLVARGLAAARVKAWSALSEPVDGTMLSVIEAAGEAAAETASSGGANAPVLANLVRTVEAAWEAGLARVVDTQRELSELTEAQVVDAGAVGLTLVLHALTCAVTQLPFSEAPYEHLAGYLDRQLNLATLAAEHHGVEVMCTVEATALNAALMRASLDGVGDSVMMSAVSPQTQKSTGTTPEDAVASQDEASASTGNTEELHQWRIHVHVREAQDALEVIRTAGDPQDVSITPLTPSSADGKDHHTEH